MSGKAKSLGTMTSNEFYKLACSQSGKVDFLKKDIKAATSTIEKATLQCIKILETLEKKK
jgi:hypothetical protein